MADMGEPLDRCRVLVVEDEAMIAMDLERLLRRAACEVMGPWGGSRRRRGARTASRRRTSPSSTSISAARTPSRSPTRWRRGASRSCS